MRPREWKIALLCTSFLLAPGMSGCGQGKGEEVAGASAGAPLILTIEDVVLQADGSPAVLLLRPDERVVFLPVDACAADLIYAWLHGVALPRPMTPDLFKSIAAALQLTVPQVVLDLGEQDSLVARISVGDPQAGAELDARIGDALAVAQRVPAQILATPRLLARHTLGASASRLSSQGVRSREPGDQAPPVLPPAEKSAASLLQTPGDPMEMRVLAVVQLLLGGLKVLLIDPAQSAVFSLFVVPCQGLAIHANLHGLALPEARPYELLRRLLELGQARMTRAAVTRLEENTFIGEIDLEQAGQTLAIDARPSDAIALALRIDVPIYVVRALVEQYGEDPAAYSQLLEGLSANP